MQEMQKRVKETVDKLSEVLIGLSQRIHSTPELGYKETCAARWQTELLKEQGFDIDMPYCGLDTAYRASRKMGNGKGPRIAFLAEYDALAGFGHACGHNIIAASSVGAGIALAKALEGSGINGEIIVMGTPGEEGEGGKIHLADRGAFEDVDFALMVHPSTSNLIGRSALAAQGLTIAFRGRPVHSASPEKGVNALTSLIALFNSIDSLRQIWPDTGRCNGIITAGGSASNIVPEFAEGKFTVRAGTKRELLNMVQGIKTAAQSASALTGATLSVNEDALFAERYPNKAMGECFKKNMEALGERMNYPDPKARVGSSDIGNVSMIVPTIHEYLAIASEEVQGHTEAFREAACSPRGDQVVLLAAKGLALTGLDLAVDADLRKKVQDEFQRDAAPYFCR